MIPYFQFTAIHLGPISLHVWGFMVAAGILIGAWVASKAAKARGLDPKHVWDLTFWITVGSFVFARLFQVIVYQPSYFLAHPLEIPAIWNGGMSIMGGFIGAVVASLIFFRLKKLDPWVWADTAIIGLPIGLAIGRIGCFLIHDHPGTATDFFLGVKYPDGIARHDLGLYESLLGFALAIVFFIFWKRNAKQGTYLAAFPILYGTARFFLDFLRATEGAVVDVRYLGLTPAQYASLLMVAVGVFIGYKFRIFQKLSAKS